MSCRVIGRNIEYKLMDIIIKIIEKENVTEIHSEYIKTNKNNLVSNLYAKCGFKILNKDEENKKYQIFIDNYKLFNLGYIKLLNNNF